MTELLSFEIPLLPKSVNKLYLRSKTGGLYINPKAVEFKNKVSEILNKLEFKKSENKIKLIIEFYVIKKNLDIDNLLKLMIDSMNNIIYDDDRQVYELHVRKIICKENKTTVKVLEINDLEIFNIYFE